MVTARNSGHYSCRRYETISASSVPTARRGSAKSSRYQTIEAVSKVFFERRSIFRLA
ncbi:hypothetical protein [Paludibacter sp. 221]|uniref:hypothetical protein n=1 Tax=Paludibacter sp. 221 TaxID=2302939 RepID=UPI0013D4D56C|nr:hypothetical protein [Paludibacter sp. 221]